jgi:hypothetical protein
MQVCSGHVATRQYCLAVYLCMLYSWNSQLRGASVECEAACSVSLTADLIIAYCGCTALQPDAPHSACHGLVGPSTQLAVVFQGFIILL